MLSTLHLLSLAGQSVGRSLVVVDVMVLLLLLYLVKLLLATGVVAEVFFYCCCISVTNTPGVHQHWSDTLAHKQPSDRIRYGSLKSFWYLQIWDEHPDFSMSSEGWSVCGEISSVRYFQPYLARFLHWKNKTIPTVTTICHICGKCGYFGLDMYKKERGDEVQYFRQD